MISDIIETIGLIKDSLDVDAEHYLNKIATKSNSIARRSKDAICYFPVLVSRSISYEDITMVNKALERQYSTYLRIAMGLEDVLDSNVSKASYIKSFHNNLGSTQNNERIMNAGNALLSKTLREDNKPYFTKPAYNSNPLLESKINDIKIKLSKEEINVSPLKEDYLAPVGRMFSEANNDSSVNRTTTTVTSKDADGNITGTTTTTTFTKNNSFSNREYVQSKSPYKDQLLDNDIKKANELIPTTLSVELRVKGQEHPTHILMGVKTTAHPIDSEEMIFNLSTAIREKRFMFRTIQWTSGEIKFFKDFVLSLDRIKRNVQDSKNKSNWWRSLKGMTLSNKIRRYTGREQLIPNTTIVVSMDEVEYIANAYGINLLKDHKRTVGAIMREFSLLGFTIVDTSSQLCYFYFDGEDDYQVLSFNALERENKNSMNDMKSLVSLLGR